MGKAVNEFGYVYSITKSFDEKDWIILEEDFKVWEIFSNDMYDSWKSRMKQNYTLPRGLAIRCEKVLKMNRAGNMYSGSTTEDEIEFKPLVKWNKDIESELISKKFRLKMNDMNGMKYSVHSLEELSRRLKIKKVLD